MAVFLKVLLFLAANRNEIIDAIKALQEILPDGAGAEKMAALKSWIGSALNLEADFEAVWPHVQPLVNIIVAQVKKT